MTQLDPNSARLLSHAVDSIARLHPYQPGKPIEELAREFDLKVADIIKLASNENPLGPSPKAMAAIADELADLTRYPDGAGFDLKAALIEYFRKDSVELKSDQITLGNGSSDILDFIVRVFVNDGDEVIVSEHAFAIYGLVTQMVGGVVKTAPAKNYGHDLQAMAALISDKTRIVFVTNPNNPTGTWSRKIELTEFLQRVPSDVIVVLDEAYVEYVHHDDYPNGLTLLDEYPNLVVTRTFSKAFGLASLRVGFGVSSPELADLMNRVRPPFNVDSFALAAAKAVLADTEYVVKSVELNDQGMALLTDYFDAKGIEYIPSVANFISFKVPAGIEASEVNQALLQEGVIVRPIANYGLVDFLRVSIGTLAENRGFIAALSRVLTRLGYQPVVASVEE